jgi:hypothetical protein
MSTQSGNVLDMDEREKLREEFQGVEERLRDTVSDVVSYIGQPAEDVYREVIAPAPVLKAFILGQISVAILWLTAYLLLKL